MTRSASDKREDQRYGSTYETRQECDKELAFSRSRLALSVKTAVRLLCLQAMSWVSKQANNNLIDGSNKKALDIGCTYGYICGSLSQLKYEAMGLDSSECSLRIGKGTNCILGDAHSPLSNPDSLNIVTPFGTFEHLARPELPLNESCRCFREEALLIIENPVANRLDLIPDKLHGTDRIRTSLPTHSEIMLSVKKTAFGATAKGLLPIPFQHFPLFCRFIEHEVLTSIARHTSLVVVKSGNNEFQYTDGNQEQKEAKIEDSYGS